MTEPCISFEGVWKKFSRGEVHDSLRDLIPALARRSLGRGPSLGLGASEFWALQDVSFDVRCGDALGIIGRNGAGKSTTLKLLTRILKPTRGTCRVTGRVGALIELAAGFHPDLTGRENVYLQGAIMGMKRTEITRKLGEIVEFAGLADFIDTPIKRYSSGMNARLGFSIAAHLDCEVLLIDEVLAVGDLAFQQRCMERLARFRRDGVTIAFVSHNMQAIAALCSRALLLRPNLPPLLGPVDEIVSAYASPATSHGDARVKLLASGLRESSVNTVLQRPVPPGTTLTLEAELQALTDLPRCAVQLYLTRSDGLRVFDGVSFTDGLSPVNVTSGSTVQVVINFCANVLRGTYSVAVNLVDHERRWEPVQLANVASFVVNESTRWGGCSEVFPSYQVSATMPDERPVASGARRE